MFILKLRCSVQRVVSFWQLLLPAGKCGMYFVEDNASDTIENSVSIGSRCPVLIFPSFIINSFCLLSVTLPGVLELDLQRQGE